MSTTSIRRPRGAPSRSAPVRAALALVLGVLVAVAGIARPAAATELPGAITDVSVREDAVGYWSTVTVDVAWSVPDDATAGDTFSLTLPEALDPSVTGFALTDPDGAIVADATISGQQVTFTLTDYVDTHQAVSGTAWFQTTLDHSVVTDDGPLPLTFEVTGGVHHDDEVTVTGTGQSIDRDVARKFGYFRDRLDQGRTEPDQAIAWAVESALGPAATVAMADAPGAGHEIDCSTVRFRRAFEFAADGEITDLADVDPASYELTCAPDGIEVVAGPLAAGELFRLDYRTTITDQSVGSYTNGATVTMDGAPWEGTATTRRSSAGGDGDGRLTPSIALEKHGTDAGPVDGDADEAPGLEVRSAMEVTVAVTNDGTEPLVDVAVADATDAGPDLVDLSCDFSALGGPASGTTWDGPFAPGDSFTCTGTLPALAPGEHHADTATVTATGASSATPVAADDPFHATNPDEPAPDDGAPATDEPGSPAGEPEGAGPTGGAADGATPAPAAPGIGEGTLARTGGSVLPLLVAGSGLVLVGGLVLSTRSRRMVRGR